MPNIPLKRFITIVVLGVLCGFNIAAAEDWPMLGRDGTRNSVSAERNGPTAWSVAQRQEGKVTRESRGMRWTAPLGLQTYSTPIVASGLVWIGTCKVLGTDPQSYSRIPVLKCFRVEDGQEVFELTSPQLGNRIHDSGWQGLGSSPLIEGDRLWIATNRAQVICLDIGPLIRNAGPPREVWKLDLIKTFDIFQRVPIMGPPRPCSIASWKDRIYVTLNNGVSEDQRSVPKPQAPSLVCLDKNTGDLRWKDNSPGANILFSQFASPTVAEIGGRVQVIVPQSDGCVRSFDSEQGRLLWEFDINPKTSKYDLARCTRNCLLANAVVYEGLVYIGSGMDVERGDGPGRLVCIDPTKSGDVSSELAVDANRQPLPRRRIQAVDPRAGELAIPNPNSALVWEFVSQGDHKKWENRMHRMMSSVAVSKGLVIAADTEGMVHCFDAKSGVRHWWHDPLESSWSSPLIVDDLVYVTTEAGTVLVFQLTEKPHLPIAEVALDDPVYSSPVFSNGTFYVAGQHNLYAVTGDKDAEARQRLKAGHWPQWRGPNRDNMAAEIGLLKEWPAAGPPLMWRLNGLGDGISPASVSGGRVFALSQYEDTEYVRALNEQSGGLLWTAVLGGTVRQSSLMRWYTQRPPTVDGELLYAMSLRGDLVCLRVADGEEVWHKHYESDFGGKPTVFGFTDCPIIEGGLLICTPGGSEVTVVALDKKTGAIRWKCPVADGGKTAFGNGIVATIDGHPQFITHLENTLVGIALSDGQLLWRWKGPVDRAHTPLVRDNHIAGINYGRGYTLLELTRESSKFAVNEVLTQPFGFFSHIQDDTIIHCDQLYETHNGILTCFAWEKGEKVWQKRLGPLFSMTFADDLLYLHGSDGKIQLVQPGEKDAAVKSEFILPDHRDAMGTTTPFITEGRLFIREDDQLFCYDVRADSGPTLDVPRVINLDPPPAKLLNEHRERTLRSVFVPTPQDIVDKTLRIQSTEDGQSHAIHLWTLPLSQSNRAD